MCYSLSPTRVKVTRASTSSHGTTRLILSRYLAIVGVARLAYQLIGGGVNGFAEGLSKLDHTNTHCGFAIKVDDLTGFLLLERIDSRVTVVRTAQKRYSTNWLGLNCSVTMKLCRASSPAISTSCSLTPVVLTHQLNTSRCILVPRARRSDIRNLTACLSQHGCT